MGGLRADCADRSCRLLTLDVLGVVDDEVSIPHHGQVHGQVADVIPFIEILQGETQESRAPSSARGREARRALMDKERPRNLPVNFPSGSTEKERDLAQTIPASRDGSGTAGAFVPQRLAADGQSVLPPKDLN